MAVRVKSSSVSMGGGWQGGGDGLAVDGLAVWWFGEPRTGVRGCRSAGAGPRVPVRGCECCGVLVCSGLLTDAAGC